MYFNINIFAFHKFVNNFIKEGKRDRSLHCFLYLLSKLSNLNPNYNLSALFLEKSLNNIYPEVYLKQMRRSRKTFYLPRVISEEKKIKISLYWIKRSTDNRKSHKKLEDRIVEQIVNAFYYKGDVIKKKRTLYNTLLINQPFLHTVKYKTKGRTKTKKKKLNVLTRSSVKSLNLN